MGRTPPAWSGRHTGRARRHRSAWHESAANEPLRCRGETEMCLLLRCGRARGGLGVGEPVWWSSKERHGGA
jgi:hypothetical protein